MRTYPALVARSCLALPLTLAVAAGGCTRPAESQEKAQKPGPHGGLAVELPEGLGWVECQFETEAGGRVSVDDMTGQRGRPQRTVVAVYFLGADAKVAREPAPSAARLRVPNDSRAITEIPLELRPGRGDPSGAARFVSPPDLYTPRSVRGKLVATIDGRDVQVPLYLR